MRWGPERLAGGRVRFRLWAPGCTAVSLQLDDGTPRSTGMERDVDGWFTATVEAEPGTRYRFNLGVLSVPDPASRRQDGGVHGWSVVCDPGDYEWRHADWRGRPWEDAVIAELHPGVLGGFDGIADTLENYAELGITAIELMPVAAVSGKRNWGYDGVLPYAVAEHYGSPDALKAMIDRAHGLGLMVILDVVYNHFGPDGNFLHAYAEDFFDTDTQTPWGPAIDFEAEPVRRFFIDNAAMWLDEFRFDGLRFDAVHAIRNDAFLDAMAAELRARIGPDRHIHLILENEHNDAARLAPTRYDAQWNDDFHNVLHVLLTGETEGYYAAFADDPTEKLARCLAQGFVYQGQAKPDGEPRGTPSGDLPPTRFVSFLQNHDQVGNRALGERLTMLADRQKLRAATALLLLCPQIPLLFMGDMDGSETPFLFFTDFHDDLADAVREGRRREFAGFAAFAGVKAREQIPDPNAESTFEASRPEPGPDAEQWRVLYRQLLSIRHTEIVPRLVGAHGIGADVLGHGTVCARWVMGDGATLTIAINLGEATVAFPDPGGEPLFADGQPGEPGSVSIWLSPA